MASLPHDEHLPQSFEIKHQPQKGRVIAFITGLSLSLTGCAANTPQVEASPFSLPIVGESLYDTYEGQHGGCDPSGTLNMFSEQPDNLERKAQECLDVYADTDIALINYSLDPNTASQFAEAIEDELAQVTDRLIIPEITIIEPSELARSIYENNVTDCTSIKNIEQYGSFIAAASMEELQPYDQIIGVGNNPVCEENVVGVADGSYHRYSEVFYVNDELTAIENNNNEEVGDNSAIQNSLVDPVMTATHEILHNFGLNHSGVFYGKTNTLNGEFNPDSDYRVNLEHYFSSGYYYEYGKSDVMGNPSESPDNTTLNPIQINTLEWPYEILGKETLVDNQDIMKAPAIFTTENNESRIASIALPIALSAPTEGYFNSSSAHQFYDKLYFTSIVSDDQVTGVNVYVAGQTGNIISLGAIYRGYGDGAPMHFELFMTGAEIYVDFTESNATVSAALSQMPTGL